MSDKFPYILAVKSLLGGYKEASDPKESTHVILPISKYDDIVNKLNRNIAEKKALSNDLEKAKSTIEYTKEELQDIKHKNFELESNNNKLNDEVEELSIDRDVLEMKNAVLKKINKEKSNKLVNPSGHKTSPGYYILKTQDSVLQYKNESNEHKVIRGNKIVLLSPYSVSIEKSIAKGLIEDDLTKEKNGKIPILRLLAGEKYYFQKSYSDVESYIYQRKKEIAAEIINRDRTEFYESEASDLDIYSLQMGKDKKHLDEYQTRIMSLNTENAFYNLNLQFDTRYPNWCVELYHTHDIKSYPESLTLFYKKKKN